MRGLEAGLSPKIGGLAFQVKLLKAVGLGPHLQGCVSCGREEELTWSPERGGLLCRKCGGTGEDIPPRVWHVLLALERLPLRVSGNLKLDEATIAIARRMLDDLAEWHLAH